MASLSWNIVAISLTVCSRDDFTMRTAGESTPVHGQRIRSHSPTVNVHYCGLQTRLRPVAATFDVPKKAGRNVFSSP
jgi:hypothetical protein